ncbi:hypothetical protein K435DRAFT_959180 [Dendrothele bispora CBS 962.96]|uniref:DUF7719 domain-containing protein n=1 Tax=Dendrothele bispora (strain CBS 962.96) TaxID=1314807 RepID=A0A4S8MZ02_DENBC|nr:hypothetical protein K435DRAFT_959180 [Dendrothele bispora CBS 962.96]
MARNRKQKLETLRPSDVKPTNQKPLIDIPEDEQWRIIQQSGILNTIADDDAKKATQKADLQEPVPLAEEILDAALYIIPLSFLLLLLEILIHNQYGQTLTLQKGLDRMVSGVPILSVFIFYTKRHKNHRVVQALLFIIANLAGTRMVWLLARGSWKVNMRQIPPLGTLWVYAVVQLHLVLAVLNLAAVFAYVRWKGLQRYF